MKPRDSLKNDQTSKQATTGSVSNHKFALYRRSKEFSVRERAPLLQSRLLADGLKLIEEMTKGITREC